MTIVIPPEVLAGIVLLVFAWAIWVTKMLFRLDKRFSNVIQHLANYAEEEEETKIIRKRKGIK